MRDEATRGEKPRIGAGLTMLALATALASACGGGAAGDQTTKFVGSWTFASGQLSPTCPPSFPVTLQPVPLAGLSVTFTKVNDTTISLVAGSAGCTVLLGVSGDKATAQPGQMCTLDVPGIGPTAVGVTSWTLAAKGAQIDSTMSLSVLVCSASGSGVLTAGGPGDGGTNGG